jgi:hypothetical protein
MLSCVTECKPHFQAVVNTQKHIINRYYWGCALSVHVTSDLKILHWNDTRYSTALTTSFTKSGVTINSYLWFFFHIDIYTLLLTCIPLSPGDQWKRVWNSWSLYEVCRTSATVSFVLRNLFARHDHHVKTKLSCSHANTSMLWINNH